MRGIGGTGIGVYGEAADGGIGVYGREPEGGFGYAGYFSGDVRVFSADLFVGDDLDVFDNANVTGILTKGGGAFKIDHPLDPENKYLYHSFVESPEMMNIYNVNVTTDSFGVAEVTLPDWFEALNRDFRYQLTVIGQFAQAIIAEEVSGDRFRIRTSLPQVKVSWQVTGVRKDSFAEKYRIPVEELKLAEERGAYLHPEAFGLPEARNVETAAKKTAA